MQLTGGRGDRRRRCAGPSAFVHGTNNRVIAGDALGAALAHPVIVSRSPQSPHQGQPGHWLIPRQAGHTGLSGGGRRGAWALQPQTFGCGSLEA